MFYRSLEGKNIQSCEEDEGLTCENSEESLKTLLESFVIFLPKIIWFWLAGTEEAAVINKIPELLKLKFVLLGYLMLVNCS